MKFSLCILFGVAVLLGGVASDFLCIVMQLTIITPDRFFTPLGPDCRGIKQRFEDVQKDLLKCTRHKISTDALESLHKEFCDRHSEFRRNFDRSRQCLLYSQSNIKKCLETMSFNAKANVRFGSTMKEMCLQLSEDTCNCMNEKIGQPCGDEGLKVYKLITEASKPFFTGICLEAAGVEPEDDEFVNKTERLEVFTQPYKVYTEADKVVEAAVAEGIGVEVGYTTAKAAETAVTEAVGAGGENTRDKISEAAFAKVTDLECAGAAANSAFLLSLLLGILIAVKWYG